MTARRPLAAAALLLLASCAALEADVRARHCNRDGAFEAGVNDGLAGRPMDGVRFTDPCLIDERAAALAGYRDGYLTALANRPPPPAAQAPAGRHAFVCEVSAFGHPYTAFGDSNDEARAKVIKACGQKEDPFFCNDPKCRRAE